MIQPLYILALMFTAVIGTNADLRLTNTTSLVPQFFREFGSERVKIDYGTYKVPAQNKDDGIRAVKSTIAPPCSDCLVTWMQAQLEYVNGPTADAETNMWMHHVVFWNAGRNDSVCPGMGGQRFFASGNERTPVDLSRNGTAKLGYFVVSSDTMFFAGELMNMRDSSQVVVLSVTWEFIPSLPSGFEQVTPYWLDVGSCSTSEMPAIADSEFSYTSPRFKSDFQGRITFIGGHLHDGGTQLEVIQNGKIVCITEAAYGGSGSPSELHHISKMMQCADIIFVKPGDELSIVAYYDAVRHQLMSTNDDILEPVMGIALAYVVKDTTQLQSSWSSWLPITLVLVAMLVYGTAAYFVRYGTGRLFSKCSPSRGWELLATSAPEDGRAELEYSHRTSLSRE